MTAIFPTDSLAQLPTCGDPETKHRIIKFDNRDVRLPEPSPGKALVFVIYKESRPQFGTLQLKFVANNEYKAVLVKNHYSYFEVEPELQRICVQAKGTLVYGGQFFTPEAGGTYFFRMGLTIGLRELLPDEGLKLVKETKFATFEVKE